MSEVVEDEAAGGVVVVVFVFVVAPRAQLLKMSAWLLHPIGDMAPAAAGDSCEVARA